MKSRDLKNSFRRIERSHYPEVKSYSRDEIYKDHLAPGGLYLAAMMTRSMNLKKNDIILDLGCGKAVSSIFLAKHFGVKVFSVDLWTSASDLNRKISEEGLRHSVLPFQLDVTRAYLLQRVTLMLSIVCKRFILSAEVWHSCDIC